MPRIIPIEADEASELYPIIQALRAQNADPPFVFVFPGGREELEAMFENSAPEDRERFLKPDVVLVYREAGRKIRFPGGEPFEMNGARRPIDRVLTSGK